MLLLAGLRASINFVQQSVEQEVVAAAHHCLIFMDPDPETYDECENWQFSN